MRIHISTLAVLCPSPKTTDQRRPVSVRHFQEYLSVFVWVKPMMSGFTAGLGNGVENICALHSFTRKPSSLREKHLPSVPRANPPPKPPLHPSLSSSAASPLSITTCVLCNADGAGRCLNPLCLYLTHAHTHMQPRELVFFFFFPARICRLGQITYSPSYPEVCLQACIK